MQRIGIVGGLGPESTIAYYRQIMAGYRARTSDGSSPVLVISSIDVRDVLSLVEMRRFDELVTLLIAELDRLARAGCLCAAIAANTPHVVFDALSSVAPLPLIDIVAATLAGARARHVRRAGLLGTRFTMQSSFYGDAFRRDGLEVIAPEPEQQAYVHDKYVRELLHGIVTDDTRRQLLSVISDMKRRRGIDGVILGGTELSLIITEDEHDGIAVLDTTKLHVEAIVARLLS